MLIVAWVQLSAVLGSGVLAVRCGSAYFFLRGHKCVLLKLWTIVCVGNGIEVKNTITYVWSGAGKEVCCLTFAKLIPGI